MIAPGRTARLYLGLDGWVYRTDDRGRCWTRTGFPRATGMGGVANNAKVNGRKIAVDPHDPDVVYVGAPRDPIRVTRDGGTTWATIDAIPQAGSRDGEHMGYLVIVDPRSPKINGRASTVYAASWGQGVHRSTDAGASWAHLPGSPAGVRHAAIGTDGILYVVADEPSDTTKQVFRFDGAWTNISPGRSSPESWHSVTVSPHDPARLVIAKDEGSLCESLNRGRTWAPLIHRDRVGRVADDVPWLAWTNENWMSNGDIQFDPAVPNRLVFAQGIGVWSTILRRRATSISWVSQSRNIEQLVSNQCVHPPFEGARPLLACYDRAIWRVVDPDAYPTRHYPDQEFNHCWGIDYASSDPAFLAAAISSQQATDRERSAFSTDGGQSWTPFRSYPNWAGAKAGKGFIAASTPRNLVWAASEGRGLPHYTWDGGETWQPCSLPGVTEEDAGGFGMAHYIRRYCVCADRVALGTFYLLHHPRGLFVTRDAGETWTLEHPFSGWNDRFHSKLRAVPGHAGHLFHTAGHSSAERHGSFVRSVDGGRTWTVLPGVAEVVDFAFGKAAEGSAYPAVYIVGYVGDVWGFYRSIDGCESWAKVGDGFPTGSLDRIAAIEADKTEFGKLYVGFWGSGWVYGTI